MPENRIPFYVYKVTIISTNEYYWGSRYYHTKSNRLPEDDLFKIYFTSSKKIKQKIQEYGVDAFHYQIVYRSYDKDDVFWHEQDRIKENWGDCLLLNEQYNDKDKGHFVFLCNEKTKKKISQHNKKLVEQGLHNFIGGEMQRAAQLKLLAEGKHTSQDPTWLKNHKKQQNSQETKLAKSNSLKNYYKTEGALDKHREYQLRPEVVKKKSESLKKIYKNNPELRKNAGIVKANSLESNAKKRESHLLRNELIPPHPYFICVNNGKVFGNMAKAGRELGVSSSSIRLVLIGRYKELRGLSFRYLTSTEVADYLHSIEENPPSSVV